MNLKIIRTRDGSLTLYDPKLDERYRSAHGAQTEAQYVFVENGFKKADEIFNNEKQIRIFELGFGTGLNTLLTIHACKDFSREIVYDSIDREFLPSSVYNELVYPELENAEAGLLNLLHKTEPGSRTSIHQSFIFQKWKSEFLDWQPDYKYHCIYFDPFGPRAQPESWTELFYRKCKELLEPGGFLVTYCAKGEVRRNMQSCGFRIEKPQGPPGKREMTRAWKPK